jgi:hypothetical protein
MTRSTGVPRASLRFARWGLPLIGALIISASLAYAMTVAVTSGPVTRETELSVATEPPASGVVESFAHSDTDDSCTTNSGRLLYVGLNSWVPAEPPSERCAESRFTQP